MDNIITNNGRFLKNILAAIGKGEADFLRSKAYNTEDVISEFQVLPAEGSITTDEVNAVNISDPDGETGFFVEANYGSFNFEVELLSGSTAIDTLTFSALEANGTNVSGTQSSRYYIQFNLAGATAFKITIKNPSSSGSRGISRLIAFGGGNIVEVLNEIATNAEELNTRSKNKFEIDDEKRLYTTQVENFPVGSQGLVAVLGIEMQFERRSINEDGDENRFRSIFVRGGKIALGGDSSYGQAVYNSDGELIFNNTSGSTWLTSFIDKNGNSYFGQTGGTIVRFDPEGESLPTISLTGVVYSIDVDDDGNIYIGTGDGAFKLNAAGDILWTYEGSGNDFDIRSIRHEGNFVYIATRSNNITKLDQENADNSTPPVIVWEDTGSLSGTGGNRIEIVGDHVFAASTGGIYKFDKSDGNPVVVDTSNKSNIDYFHFEYPDSFIHAQDGRLVKRDLDLNEAYNIPLAQGAPEGIGVDLEGFVYVLIDRKLYKYKSEQDIKGFRNV